jgi:hypothetical protein
VLSDGKTGFLGDSIAFRNGVGLIYSAKILGTTC